MEPLNPSHSQFDVLSSKFINLHNIERKFNEGQYQTTWDLGSDMRQMFSLGPILYSNDSMKLQQAEVIKQYFEDIFNQIGNQ